MPPGRHVIWARNRGGIVRRHGIRCHTWERISWDDAATDHIAPAPLATRPLPTSTRAWTVEGVHDPDRLVDEPDPRSAHINSVRIVGYSPTARMVITVVALRDPYGGLHGASAWQSTGAALRQYLEDRSDD